MGIRLLRCSDPGAQVSGPSTFGVPCPSLLFFSTTKHFYIFSSAGSIKLSGRSFDSVSFFFFLVSATAARTAVNFLEPSGRVNNSPSSRNALNNKWCAGRESGGNVSSSTCGPGPDDDLLKQLRRFGRSEFSRPRESLCCSTKRQLHFQLFFHRTVIFFSKEIHFK